MSLLIPDVGLIFWMVIVFGVVLWVLTKYGFPPILRMIDHRKSFIDDSLEQAREAEEKVGRLHDEASRILAEAHEEERRVIGEAAKTRSRMLADAQQEVHQEKKKQLDRLKQQLQAEREAAVNDARKQVGALAVDVAEKILRKELDNTASQVELINRILDEMPQKSTN